MIKTEEMKMSFFYNQLLQNVFSEMTTRIGIKGTLSQNVQIIVHKTCQNKLQNSSYFAIDISILQK